MSKQRDASPFYDVLQIPIWDPRSDRFYRDLNTWLNEFLGPLPLGDLEGSRGVLNTLDVFRWDQSKPLGSDEGIGERIWPSDYPAVLAVLEARAWSAGAR